MTAATATRAKSPAPLGTGDLHRALEASTRSAALESFCCNTGTQTDEVSADGHSLDILRVFDAMRARGYYVAQPVRPQHQPRKGFTGWLVHVCVRGAEFDLAFYTPDSAAPARKAARKKSNLTTQAH